MHLKYTRFSIWFLGSLLVILFFGYLFFKPLAAYPDYKQSPAQLPIIFTDINKNFSRVQFDDLTKDLIIPNDVSRRDWLNSLYAFSKSYQSFLSSLAIAYNDSTLEARLTTIHDRTYYFADGKMLPPADYKQASQYRSYLYDYPTGERTVKPEPGSFPAPLNYTFYYEIYGYSTLEKKRNLGIVDVWGRKLNFNKMNDAAENLKQAVAEISKEAKTNADVKKWLNNIQSISTYNDRSIANDNRPSFHSWGIAIDILPKGKKALYWLWVSQYRKDWGELKDTEKAYVPLRVIGIFEKYGFTWGGKWYHYDLMHFEYQPEVILYNTPSKLNSVH